MASRALVGLAHHADQGLRDEDVLRLARAAVDAAGGLPVGRGDTVFLKPNQTVWFPATDGVTTDPRLVAALATLSFEHGARRVLVGDGCGGDLRSRKVMQVTGVERLAKKAGAEVVPLEEAPQRAVPLDVDGARWEIPVAAPLLDADVVVNVPKAKTHFEDVISCCLKAWVGIIDQGWRPRVMADPLLAKVTVRLHAAVPAALNVVDALWCGEGQGPAANTPLWAGCVVAGRDPAAVDTTVARLMSLPWQQLVFAREAAALGLGMRDPADIDVAGAPLAEVAVRAKPTVHGLDDLPLRALVGDGVTWAGSAGHFKSLADVFQKYHAWEAIERVYGRPTFMIGRVHDPDFFQAVKKGPYFVIDDAAYDEYKFDERVTYIPGHPATHNIFPHIFRRLHVPHAGPALLGLMSVLEQVQDYFHFRNWEPARPTQPP